MAKATIEALLARKDKGGLKTKEVHVPALDMDVVVEKKPLSVVAGFFDDMRSDMSFSKIHRDLQGADLHLRAVIP